jgi:hypothetical protein
VRTVPTNDEKAIQWLLEHDQPAIRYLALTQLLERPARDPEVQSARKAIPERGWAADILAQQDKGGWWAGDRSLYRPKYLATNWMLLILSDLGLTRAQPGIRAACELWLDRFVKEDGGFAMDGSKKSHLCTTGNMARALVRFEYEDHPKVTSAFEWLARNRDKKGGWSCFGSGRNLDSWEALSAFAVYPRARWTEEMKEAVTLGCEFFLERELHLQGEEYPPWYRFHYPVHYYYDVLVGLDLMTALGHGRDPRLNFAVSLLKKKRRRDGRWNLDAIHPDVEGGMERWMRQHPKQAPASFALEKAGQPSAMITLTALSVLRRLDEAA